MKQTTLFSEMAFGAIAGTSFVRKLVVLNIKLILITIAMGSFIVVMTLRDYFPGESPPVVRDTGFEPKPARNQQSERLDSGPVRFHQQIAPEPPKDRQPKPPPSNRVDVEEFRRLARPNPL